jgi:hypothetical protein
LCLNPIKISIYSCVHSVIVYCIYNRLQIKWKCINYVTSTLYLTERYWHIATYPGWVSLAQSTPNDTIPITDHFPL